MAKSLSKGKQLAAVKQIAVEKLAKAAENESFLIAVAGMLADWHMEYNEPCTDEDLNIDCHYCNAKLIMDTFYGGKTGDDKPKFEPKKKEASRIILTDS